MASPEGLASQKGGLSKEFHYIEELCIIEINNELEVFVQISKTDVGFGNNRGRRPRLLQNPNEVFDICTNTSNKLFISILS